jgi:myotubularin-related protein 1/2
MSQFRLAPSYPALFIVPRDVSDEQLFQVARYRSQGRLPCVVWRDPETGATLSRCAQPLTGLAGKRCQEDEELIKAIRLANPTNATLLYFVDFRPYTAAVGNKMMGKGTEKIENYENARLVFMDIDNIHAVRDSMDRLMRLCNEDPESGNGVVITQKAPLEHHSNTIITLF